MEGGGKSGWFTGLPISEQLSRASVVIYCHV
jgi:hypothetical protein